MAENIIKLYHTGFKEIKSPDIHYGRKNADFGQGFYTSDSEEFVLRWAKERNGEQTIINNYELDVTGLKLVRFERSSEWFEYIFKNRAGYEDEFADADVIIGSIANDTLYDTYGLITSGFLPKEDSLKLLMVGSQYYQIVIKTERAVSQLKWLSSRIIPHSELEDYRALVRQEETEFRRAFNEGLKALSNYEEIADMLS